MLRFAFRAPSPAPVLATSLLAGILLAGTVAGCTVTPDYFPACVNPYVDTCPVGDASPDGDDGGGSEPDATSADEGFSVDAATDDATTSGEAAWGVDP